MCVRYTLHQDDKAMAAIAAVLARKLTLPEGSRPRFNVALTNVMPVVAAGADGPEARAMRWGLVPAYERASPQPRLLPNAKAETAATLSAFKQGVARRRCLVPANGFYEWQTLGRLKLPHLFTLTGEEPFAFAGIWEPAAEEDQASPASGLRPLVANFPTYAILTTEPNELVAPIHNRMPVILTTETMARWLGSEPLFEPEYRALTRPLPAARMRERQVSRFMSNSRHEGPECHEPPEAALPELPFG